MTIQSSFWENHLTIGKLQLPRFMAAPLDGITDSPLRQLIRNFSTNNELLMGEMRHISCVANEKNSKSLLFNTIEHPLAFQFSANRLDFMEEAIEKVIAAGFIMINLNCGCPAPVVIKSGSGSALMANPEKMAVLLKAFIKIINGRVPFTLKIRAGFKQRNAVEIAKLAQDCGVEAIMIHPRTQPEGFTSKLDFDLVANVKAAVSIPVIFSGNINRFEAAKRTYELTGVDGFMIGRALWGAPWKMREITDAAIGKTFSIKSIDMLNIAFKHLELNTHFYGQHGFTRFKKQLPQYIKFVENAAEWRMRLLRSQANEEMFTLLNELYTITKTHDQTS